MDPVAENQSTETDESSDDKSDGGCPIDATSPWPENTCRDLVLWRPPRAGQQRRRHESDGTPRDLESHGANQGAVGGRRFPSRERSHKQTRDTDQRTGDHRSQHTQAPRSLRVDGTGHDRDDRLYSNEEGFSPRFEQRGRPKSARPRSQGIALPRKGGRFHITEPGVRFSGTREPRCGQASNEARSDDGLSADVVGRKEPPITPGVSRRK